MFVSGRKRRRKKYSIEIYQKKRKSHIPMKYIKYIFSSQGERKRKEEYSYKLYQIQNLEEKEEERKKKMKRRKKKTIFKTNYIKLQVL